MSAVVDGGRLLRVFWDHERRHVEVAIFDALLLPFAMAYLGSMIAGDDPERRRFFVAAGITMGLGNGSIFLVGTSLLEDRFHRRLQLIRTLPVSKGTYLSAHLALGIVQSCVVAASAWVTLFLFGWTPLSVESGFCVAVAAVCSGLSMGGLAAAVALRVRDEITADGALLFCAVVLVLISPVFYPPEVLPAAVRPLAWLSPYSHVAALVRAFVDATPPHMAHVAGAVLLAIVFHVGSYRAIRWQG